MTGRARPAGALSALLGWLFLAACSSSPQLAPTTSAPATLPSALAATATPDPGPPQPVESRLDNTVHVLAEDIGPRPAGSSGEQRAVAYLKQQLESLGYEVTLQSFPFSSRAYRQTSLRVLSPPAQPVPDIAVTGAAEGSPTGSLVDAGFGDPGDMAAETVTGAIAVIRAGGTAYATVASRALAAGAAGVILVNDKPGKFNPGFDPPVEIPAVGIGNSDGEALLARMRTGTVTASMDVGGSDGTGTNVIAHPRGRGCDTVTGAHFDSVPQSPGANDNASGTAVVLELARVAAASRLPGNNCFALFSGEEFGLFGSRAYVQSLSDADRGRLRLMLEFDMSAVGSQWLLVGSPGATGLAEQAAAQAGVPAVPGDLAGRSSDFASFQSQDIPAVLVFDSDDALIHTPEDAVGHLETGDMEQAARLGIALLQLLAASPATPTPGPAGGS